jgi:hypothetical protein
MKNIKKFIPSIILLFCLSGCYNWTGANFKQAEKEAKFYAKEATKAGADVKFVSCMKYDTDHDGYLACSFLINGAPATLDCAGKAFFMQNHGCKEYVAKMRGTANI